MTGELMYVEMPEFSNGQSVHHRQHGFGVTTSELRGESIPYSLTIDLRNPSDPDIKTDSLRSEGSASSLGSTLGSSTLS
jgi:hypothetical protein